MPAARPRVLVTRAAHQGSELADHLRVLGADPVLIPAIETTDPTSFAPLDHALAHLDDFHWLLFTSANAAEAFASRFSSPEAALPRIAAIGPSTARALQKHNLSPDLIPPQAVAESLAEALLPHARQPNGRPTRFLLLRAEEAREHLPETLRAAGAEVTIAPAYRTVLPSGSIDRIQTLFQPSHPARSPSPEPPVDAITFTSSSTARNLLALCEAAGVTLPEAALRISIGPITSQTLRDLGLPPHAEAPEATVAALAHTTLNALQNR
jgi:uroporphyrinogen-III synthase